MRNYDLTPSAVPVEQIFPALARYKRVMGGPKSLDLRIYGRRFTLICGPLLLAPVGIPTVSLATEYKRKESTGQLYEVHIPIEDFSVPSPKVMATGMLQAVKLLAKYKIVYVGCAGGIGRTGLFLSCFLKMLNSVVTPVEYIRSLYNVHAVETQKQAEFVRNFKPMLLPFLIRGVLKFYA